MADRMDATFKKGGIISVDIPLPEGKEGKFGVVYYSPDHITQLVLVVYTGLDGTEKLQVTTNAHPESADALPYNVEKSVLTSFYPRPNKYVPATELKIIPAHHAAVIKALSELEQKVKKTYN